MHKKAPVSATDLIKKFNEVATKFHIPTHCNDAVMYQTVHLFYSMPYDW